MTPRAKSRLSLKQINKLSNERKRAKSVPKKTLNNKSYSFWKNYLKLLPTLALGLIFSGGLVLLLIKIRPTTIANWGLYHSYLPLLILFFLASLFICSFLMQKARTGLMLAVFLTILLFFQLQDVVITPAIAISLGALMICVELIARLAFKR